MRCGTAVARACHCWTGQGRRSANYSNLARSVGDPEKLPGQAGTWGTDTCAEPSSPTTTSNTSTRLHTLANRADVPHSTLVHRTHTICQLLSGPVNPLPYSPASNGTAARHVRDRLEGPRPSLCLPARPRRRPHDLFHNLPQAQGRYVTIFLATACTDSRAAYRTRLGHC